MSDVEAAVRAHAGRVVAHDAAAVTDLASGATVEPPDLLERLLGGSFRGFELVAHARIGAHHIVKTKYLGATTIVVQARWVQEPAAGPWRLHEAQITRIATDDEG